MQSLLIPALFVIIIMVAVVSILVGTFSYFARKNRRQLGQSSDPSGIGATPGHRVDHGYHNSSGLLPGFMIGSMASSSPSERSDHPQHTESGQSGASYGQTGNSGYSDYGSSSGSDSGSSDSGGSGGDSGGGGDGGGGGGD